jgi:hypothetical protein
MYRTVADVATAATHKQKNADVTYAFCYPTWRLQPLYFDETGLAGPLFSCEDRSL